MRDRTAGGAAVGDVIVVEARHVGSARRLGEVLEVLGEPTHEHYRVRWDDGRESIFYPQSRDATIERHDRERAARAATPAPADPVDDEPVLRHEP